MTGSLGMAARIGFGVVLAVAAAAVVAQEEPDFDPAAADAPTADTHWFGEGQLRYDRVEGLPNNRPTLERERLRLRFGGMQQDEDFTFLAALEAGIGTGANKDTLINNDLERVDHVDLDQLLIQRRFAGSTWNAMLQAGKAPLTLDLSPLLWDADLRAWSLAGRATGAAREYDRWQFDFGVFSRDPSVSDGAELTAAQFSWHVHEGAPRGAGVQLAYLHWAGVDEFARRGLGRGNTLVSGRYRDDFHLLDAQAYLRWDVASRPLVARLDLVSNLGAEDEDRGARASLTWGDRSASGWEFGWAWQRMQRNAVLAAVTSDDWWFHTAARGHMPWVGYGFNETWSLRLAAFFETRDGLNDRTERLLLDLDARW